MTRANVIACEDRRVTAKLLTAYNIRTQLVSYHDHNAEHVRPRLIQRLQKGESVALVSDAGTPLIADPGYKLAQACIATGLSVVPIPGPNAAITALTASGLPPEPFRFCGFLPVKAGARQRVLAALTEVDATLVFYESPRRLAASLRDLVAAFGDRPAVVARELTKLHEEFVRDTLESLADHYAEQDAPKGEVVILVGPPSAKDQPNAAEVDALLRAALAKGSLRDAADEVAAATGLPRRRVYAQAVKLRSTD